MKRENYQEVSGVIIEGHGVASGKNELDRFPEGTLALQAPHFLARGFDTSQFYSGTLNVSIAPKNFEIRKPKYCFEGVKWDERFPAENFSFIPCYLEHEGSEYQACIYYPDPETKPDHFQDPQLLEILAPMIAAAKYGNKVTLYLPIEQIVITC